MALYTVAIAGLGLIGGSMAKALHARTPHTVLGYDHAPETLRMALNDGVITAATEDFSAADIVLVALRPGDAVAFLQAHAASLRPGTLVVDLCGVKRTVCDAARALFADSGVHYIGGHPMAGREVSGYENALPHLYEGASMILTPDSSTPPEALEKASAFFHSLGFRHMEVTTPERHDEMIAYTSQLAHVVSNAYVQSPVSRNWEGFSAGSFKDLTRVAKLDESMWTELFLCNADYLTGQLDVLVETLTHFRDLIQNGNAAELQEMLRRGREMKESLNEQGVK